MHEDGERIEITVSDTRLFFTESGAIPYSPYHGIMDKIQIGDEVFELIRPIDDQRMVVRRNVANE